MRGMSFEGVVLPATLGGINVERRRELVHGWPLLTSAMAVHSRLLTSWHPRPVSRGVHVGTDGSVPGLEACCEVVDDRLL
jgi:hypothetical protein